MEIKTTNEFDNYLNGITFQVAKLTGVSDSEMLEEFKIYLKDYVLGEILERKSYIDLDSVYGIPVGVKIALSGSGISHGTLPGTKINTEGFINSSFLYRLALEEAYILDREIGNNYFPDKITQFLKKSKRESYYNVVSDLVNYELGLCDRRVGYVAVKEDDDELVNSLSECLNKLKIEVLKEMRITGFNSSNSITYNIVDELFDNTKHYTLPEKRALIGMVYVDTALALGEKVDNNIISQTLLNIEAASYTGNEIINRYKNNFNRQVKDYYGMGKIRRL